MSEMVPFYERFRELAFREMRSATVRGQRDLPDGEYGFLESYCADSHCDCRRVLINVVTPTRGSKIWATINYGWESLEFYTKWMRNEELARTCRGATLDMLNPQTEYASALLDLFKWVMQDHAYVERLKRHYWLFKSDLRGKRKSATRSSSQARRRR
jgi:hypothetical protein